MDFITQGWLQGIHEISATAKHSVGALRLTADGRKFRYAKAGGTLSAGKATVAPQANADHVDEAITAAVAVGTSQLTLTVTAGTAIAEDNLKGGFLQINDEAGEGHQYLIDSNTAISSSGTDIVVTLVDPIRVALTTSSEFSLITNPFMDVTSSATDENFCTGVCPMAVTDNYYFWSQTGGPACALILDTPAVGSNLIYSPSGALAVIATDVDVDVPIVGYAYGTAGVTTEYKPVFLTID